MMDLPIWLELAQLNWSVNTSAKCQARLQMAKMRVYVVQRALYTL